MLPEDVRKYNYFNHVVCQGYIASVCISSTSILLCAVTTRHTAAQTLRQPRRTMRVLVSRLQRLYLNYIAHLGDSVRRAARRQLLCSHRASKCLSSSRGSSSTTSPTPRVRVPRHVTRLLVRLLVDYSDYTARSGASARRAACYAARRAARHRLLRLRRASGCLGTSRGSSCCSSSTTSTTPRVQVTRLIARLVAQLIVDYFAYATSGCRGTSRGPSRGSLSTTPCAATSSCGHNGSTSATPYVATTCLVATLALLRVRHTLP
jgi:hypothetical protein